MSKAILAAILISAIAFWQSPSQTQQSAIPPAQTERVLIDAYDAAHVNGLVFISGQANASEQNLFGLRFLVSGSGGIEVSPGKFELGPHAPDGKFARVSWHPEFDSKTTVTLRWHREGKQLVVGQLSATGNVRLTMETYRPWNDARNESNWTIYSTPKDNRTIFGEQIHNQKNKAPLNRFVLRTERAATGHPESPTIPLPSPNASLMFDLKPDSPIGFVAAVGDEFETIEREIEKLTARPVTELLDKAEKEYAAIGATTGGSLGDSLEAITRLTMWNRLYSPSRHYEYITPHRLSGLGMRGDVLGEDSLLLSLLAGLTDGESATSSLRNLLIGQTPDGRVPLRRYQQSEPAGESPVLAGRSMPPLGALAVFKVYLATQDLAFLAWAYPRLQQWNNWWSANTNDGRKWRDGNGDGLLENGFDAELEYGDLGARSLTNANKQQMALAEAGLLTTEAKFNDEVHTLTMSPVALNSLFALDTELMGLIAREMGMTDEADRWQARYDEIKRLINEHLWSEDDKLYLDRHWDGKFSSRKALDLLLPLAAGIPDQPRAKLLLNTLAESKEMVAITPPDQAAISYLIYLGMKRYGFEKQAAELAQQNLKAAAMAKSASALSPQRPAFAPLMYLPAIEEVLAADPWFGLTFGNLNATEEARIERMKIAGASYDITISPKRTVIRRDGKVEVEFEGPVKLRGYRSNDRALACLVETKTEVRTTIPGEEGKKITASVDEKVLGSASVGAAASFKIKEGSHKLLVVK
ncbi:MAG TPA: trehalase family glycosidase [Blastocatellia bacterium]|nr:trehalase family glycosidase [Blastocatellia bacterium]